MPLDVRLSKINKRKVKKKEKHSCCHQNRSLISTHELYDASFEFVKKKSHDTMRPVITTERLCKCRCQKNQRRKDLIQTYATTRDVN